VTSSLLRSRCAHRVARLPRSDPGLGNRQTQDGGAFENAAILSACDPCVSHLRTVAIAQAIRISKCLQARRNLIAVDMLGDALVYGFSLFVLARSARWQAGALAKGGFMLAFGLGVLGEAFY
jgi:hypothetical protein